MSNENPENKKLVQKLVFLMKKYSIKTGETPEKVKQVLLEKYNISSRKELTTKQLVYQIDCYKFGLLEE